MTCDRVARIGSASSENPLYVVAIRIENEGGVVPWRIACVGVAKPRRTIVCATRFQGGRVKGVDLFTALCCEGSMLLHAVRVKAVNPEHGIDDSVARCGRLGRMLR